MSPATAADALTALLVCGLKMWLLAPAIAAVVVDSSSGKFAADNDIDIDIDCDCGPPSLNTLAVLPHKSSPADNLVSTPSGLTSETDGRPDGDATAAAALATVSGGDCGRECGA